MVTEPILEFYHITKNFKNTMGRQYSFLERFLQTVAAGYFTILIYYHLLFLSSAYYLIFHTNYWYILLIFAAWTWYDRETPHTGGRSSRIMRSLPFLKHIRDYFPAKLVKTADLDPNKNYLFCSYPHGLVSASTFVNLALDHSLKHQMFPGCKFHVATSDFNFLLPFFREFILANGAVSASSRSLKYLVNDSKKGNVTVLMLGGANEVRYTQRGQYRIILKKRKGFVRLAMNEGCCIVPVFTFGENDIYELLLPKPGSLMHRLQQWVSKKFNLFLALPVGRAGLLKFLPKREPLTTIVGKPLQMPKVDEPTSEQIDYYHSLYTEELLKLFNEHKHKYLEDPNTELIIAE